MTSTRAIDRAPRQVVFTSFALFVAATPNHYTALVHVTTAADRTGISDNLDLWNNNQGMATHSVNDVWEWLIFSGTVFFALGAGRAGVSA